MRVNKKEAPVLLAQSGPLQGSNWVINKDLMIGREPDCDIVINDRQVSRYHAEIRDKKNGEFVLVDLESKNGTIINGELVSGETVLNDSDEIKIALAQEFIFVSSDATLPLNRIVDARVPLSKKLFIELKARRVWLGEQKMSPPLSVSQFSLLVLLYQNEGKVISREEIVNSVWGEQESVGVTEQAIDALVRRLRTRLRKTDKNHDYIRTIRGVGYIFENEDY